MSKEMSRIDEHGHMHCISYAAQSPWLRHQSIKDNILFGYPYDEDRYNAVVKACALEQDLDMLEDGDATEIGARGVSLSGGQKARVALARAVYARTKYVLLDDPLSAVVCSLPFSCWVSYSPFHRTVTLLASCMKVFFVGLSLQIALWYVSPCLSEYFF